MFAVHRQLFSIECHYRKTSLSLPRYYRGVFTVPTALLSNFPRPRGNYRGYRGITAFPITVSSSTVWTTECPLWSHDHACIAWCPHQSHYLVKSPESSLCSRVHADWGECVSADAASPFWYKNLPQTAEIELHVVCHRTVAHGKIPSVRNHQRHHHHHVFAPITVAMERIWKWGAPIVSLHFLALKLQHN